MSNKSSFTGWAIAIIIGLLGLNAYQWYNTTELKKVNTQKQAELFEIEKVQAELEKDYQDALESIENLRDDSKELNNLIDNQKQELAAQKKRISGLIWTSRELDKAKEEIASIKGMADGYISEINTLKAQNQQLMASNKTLNEEKVVLTNNLETEIKEKEEIAEARAVLVSEKEELTTLKKELDEKVEVASAIKVNWLQVQGYQLKDNGEMKKKKKAKDVDVFRICYKTETNVTAKAGEETFYVRYITPQGETLAVESLGSGVLTNKMTGEDVRYSGSGTVEYNNEDTEGCIDWQINFAPPKGIYEVEMYNKGFLCGKGSFKLK